MGLRCSCLRGVSQVLEVSSGTEVPADLPSHVRSKTVGLFYDARMTEHRNLTSPDYPEQPLRIVRIFEQLEKEGLVERCKQIPCREATRPELELKHTSSHVDSMLSVASLSQTEAKRFALNYNSVYLCPESTQAGLLASGSVIEAVSRVCSGEIQSAACVVRPPGHHAECACAMGFCMFGNVALAAAQARNFGWSARTLIVDWDVHHGNGTQNMFAEDPTVLFFSTHRYDGGMFYPGGKLGNFTSHGVGAGEGYSVNVPWDVKGAKWRETPPPGDAEYMAAFERVLLPIAADFKPDLVLVSAGFDSATGDPLGGVNVSPSGFYRLTKLLMGLANGRVVLALEGGYNLDSISVSMAACVRALLGDPPEVETLHLNHATPEPFYLATISDVQKHLAKFWPSLHSIVEAEAASVSAPSPTEVPSAALVGGMFEMQITLRQYAEDTGGDYEALRRKHEAILFKLDDMPRAPHADVRTVSQAIKQSFGQVGSCRRYLAPIIRIASPEQSVRNVGLSTKAGVHGVWLTNDGHARVPWDSPGLQEAISPQRISLRATPGPENEAGRAQLQALVECFDAVRAAFPTLWIGLRVPQLNAAQVFSWIAEHCSTADAVWLHDLPCRPAQVSWEKQGFGHLARDMAVRLDKWHSLDDQPHLLATKQARQRCNWLGLVFGSIAAKHQEPAHHAQNVEGQSDACQTLLRHWASLARCVCDVVVTDIAEDNHCVLSKLAALKRMPGLEFPLALRGSAATSITPEVSDGVDFMFADGSLSADGSAVECGLLDFDEKSIQDWATRWAR